MNMGCESSTLSHKYDLAYANVPKTKLTLNHQQEEVDIDTNYVLFLKVVDSVSEDEFPPFMKKLFLSLKENKFSFMSGRFKDVFLLKRLAVSLEKCSVDTFKRRAELYKRLEHIESSHVLFAETMFMTNDFVFQKFDRYKGDVFDLMIEMKGNMSFYYENISNFVVTLTTALIDLFDHDVYLTDLKPENILYRMNAGTYEFAFSDLEDALFLDSDFMDDELCLNDVEERKEFIRKRKAKRMSWIRTIEYTPHKSYPACRAIAMKNAVYAWLKTIYTLTIIVYANDDTIKFKKEYMDLAYIPKCVAYLRNPSKPREVVRELLLEALGNKY